MKMVRRINKQQKKMENKKIKFHHNNSKIFNKRRQKYNPRNQSERKYCTI